MTGFDRYSAWCAVAACSITMSASLLGFFDGWPWWLWLPSSMAVGAMSGEVAEVLRERAEHRASAGRETPP